MKWNRRAVNDEQRDGHPQHALERRSAEASGVHDDAVHRGKRELSSAGLCCAQPFNPIKVLYPTRLKSVVRKETAVVHSRPHSRNKPIAGFPKQVNVQLMYIAAETMWQLVRS